MNIHCKYDSLVEVGSLKPHPKNRNKHPDDQIERLAKILKYQGVRAPIVVSRRSNKIVKGHGTLRAIKANQWDKAPVVYQDFEDDDQEWLFVQSDNAIASWAELDLKGINADIGELGPFDIDLIGIKDFEVEPLDKLLGDDDAVPDAKPTDIKLGDLFILGDHRLLCGDSTDAEQVERLMSGEKADMVFTDPPYGMNYSGRGTNTKNKILNDNADPTIFYNLLTNISERYIWGRVENYENLKQKPRDVIIWKKNNFGMGSGYRGQYEVCFYYGNFNGSDSDVWEHKKDIDYKHPTQKPVELCERAIKNSNPKTIIDLFGGSGSTLIACEKTNRKCFMMELDPQYCQVIIDRWEQYTGKKAVKHG